MIMMGLEFKWAIEINRAKIFFLFKYIRTIFFFFYIVHITGIALSNFSIMRCKPENKSEYTRTLNTLHLNYLNYKGKRIQHLLEFLIRNL